MCPPMWAHWCHLANMIEHVLPSAHPSPQPKRQIDWFSHFCTTYRNSVSFTVGDPFPEIAPSHGEIWTLIQLMISSAILSPQSKWHHDWFSHFHTGDCRVSLYFTIWCPFPRWKLLLCMGDLDPHLIHGSLGPPESSTQMASRSVQPLLQGPLVWQTDRQTTLLIQ